MSLGALGDRFTRAISTSNLPACTPTAAPAGTRRAPSPRFAPSPIVTTLSSSASGCRCRSACCGRRQARRPSASKTHASYVSSRRTELRSFTPPTPPTTGRVSRSKCWKLLISNHSRPGPSSEPPQPTRDSHCSLVASTGVMPLCLGPTESATRSHSRIGRTSGARRFGASSRRRGGDFATGKLRIAHRDRVRLARLDTRCRADAHVPHRALLLDLDDPTRVIGRLREPLLSPSPEECDGYVPNVVYSCGAIVHADTLLLPYGIGDAAIGFATARLPDLLSALGA